MSGRGMWPDDKGGPEEELPEPKERKRKPTDEELEAARSRVAKQRSLDEGSTILTDHFPTLWWGLYANLKERGFSEEQAFSLLKCYVLKDGINGVHVHQD